MEVALRNKIKNNKKIVIVILSVLLVLIIIPSLITFFIYDYYFGKRIIHDNTYFEYLSEQNINFVKEEISFNSDNNQVLHGAFYSQTGNDTPKGLVVWVHGMGVSHENYLAEIEWLTKENYVVFSYDNTGVEDSEGDTLKGLTQAPIDLKYALDYLKDSEQYNELPTILVGHSWGGFAVSAVSELGLPFEVDGIVSLAGFWQNVNVIEDIAKNYVGETVMLIHPFLVIYEKMIFGENAALNGLDGLSNTNAPVLMIHSKDDEVVSFDGNFEVYKEMYEEDPRFTFIEYEDSGHKLTVNADSYERIHDIMHHQVEHDENSEEFLKLNEERLSLIGDFNLDVMNNILDFCDEICSSDHE